METERWRNRELSIASRMFLDLYDELTGNRIGTIEFDRNGNSFFTNVLNGVDQTKDILVDSMQGNGFKFKFWKIGRAMTVLTDFHVEKHKKIRLFNLTTPQLE